MVEVETIATRTVETIPEALWAEFQVMWQQETQ